MLEWEDGLGGCELSYQTNRRQGATYKAFSPYLFALFILVETACDSVVLEQLSVYRHVRLTACMHVGPCFVFHCSFWVSRVHNISS